jgi:hypothetical protein
MRLVALALLCGLALAVPAGGAEPAREPPSEQRIVGMALLRMVERLDFLANASFGPSVVHPQTPSRSWAVVGRAVSGALTGNMRRHVFVVAVSLACPDAADDACWQLEKLAIDDRIVFDSGRPL